MGNATSPLRLQNGRGQPKLGQVRILPLDSIFPSPENEQLYRPIDPSDPATVAMAESIREHGILQPLDITLDSYIISGHRRHVAARLAGLTAVPCRIEPFRRSDAPNRFLVLLREHNRQRVKSLDEQLREEVVTADPTEAYESLIEHRRHRAADALGGADILFIPDGKQRARISKAKLPFLEAVKKILSERREYWPLSVRGIHYPLLNDPPLIHASKPSSTYANTLESYKALDDLLTRARIFGVIPMGCIDDETRPVITWDAHRTAGDFIARELAGFLKGYWRDLMQSQPNHLEIVGEKNTLHPILKPVAAQYCIPLTSGRGFASVPPRFKMAERFRKSGKERLVVLIVSDFDPEGEQIPESFAVSMRRDFGIKNIDAIKVALTANQVNTLDLPPALDAKKSSSRYKKFAAKHGDKVHEVEALSPGRLQEILQKAIDSVLDVDAFNAEVDAEREDAASLENVRRRVRVALAGVVSNDGDDDE
ncbi:MAG: ParB N-terminal domain-containing protein [Thermoguttaceae bacterium]|jgi:hypothetical protein